MAGHAFPSATVLWLLAGLCATYALVSALRSWHRLRHVPGPFLAGFSYLGVLAATRSGQLATVYDRLAAQYGPLVRVGPDLLLTDDLALLRTMSAARSPYGKGGDYKATIRHPDHHSMLSTTDVAAHDEIKSRLAGP